MNVSASILNKDFIFNYCQLLTQLSNKPWIQKRNKLMENRNAWPSQWGDPVILVDSWGYFTGPFTGSQKITDRSEQSLCSLSPLMLNAQNNHFVLSDHVHLAIKHFCDGSIFFQDENAHIQGVIKLTKWFDENDVNHIPGHLLWGLLLAEVLLSSIIFKIPNQGISF